MSELKKMELLFKEGKITRRDFLARTASLAALMSISPTMSSSLARAATPKKGGRLRMALWGGSTSDSLDPATMAAQMPINVNWQIRNNVVEIDWTGKPNPELAESFESTPDAATWIFKLRKGIEFHNGKALDAEDVVFSINHHRGDHSKSAAKGLVSAIKDIKADGKYTVIFKLKAGNADFPFILGDYHLSIVPAGTTGLGFEKGIGTGGYTLSSWEPGVRVLTKRNPNYWKEGCAHFDEVETLGVADVTARMNALMTGEVDLINRCEPKTANLLEKRKNLQLIKTTGCMHYSFPMRCDMPPYDKKDVRLALKYAVNREDLVERVLQGYGQVGNDHPIAPFQRYFASELPQREYDTDKARYHIKKAGMAGHIFKLHVSDGAFQGAVDAGILYKEHAAKAGINIEIVREPADGYWNSVWRKKPWCASYWGGRASEDMMLSLVYAADANWNDTQWKNDRFNRLLVEARAELDEAKRGEMYAEMQSILNEDGGALIPMFAEYVYGASDRLRHDEISGFGELDHGRCAEQWWFA